MAAIDENSEWLGVSRSLLMENAGGWVAKTVYQWLGGVADRGYWSSAEPGIMAETGLSRRDTSRASEHAFT